jgi:hypothetical protein
MQKIQNIILNNQKFLLFFTMEVNSHPTHLLHIALPADTLLLDTLDTSSPPPFLTLTNPRNPGSGKREWSAASFGHTNVYIPPLP